MAFLACFYLLCVVAKHNVGTFKQLSSWQDLMSAWKGGVFACSGPEWLSQDRWTEKGKYQRQSWNKTVTCEGFHGYDKSQHQFWEKGPDEKVTPGEVSVPVSINRVEQFLLLPYRKT